MKSNQHSDKQQIELFKQIIWDYFNVFGRNFAWRQTTNPYNIVVSEIMLQQTQTQRVTEKYEHFISTFPDFISLAAAPLREVIAVWQGLGYNRRALYLQRIAQQVINEHNGILPDSPDVLVDFPGIGKATAASICAFAFNKPTIFIETNIRTVFIHFFFLHEAKVHDNQLFPLIEQTVDKINPRHWYYALMDYGVMLKNKFPNPSRKSVHHTKQSKFEGSDRQIRGLILKQLADFPQLNFQQLASLIDRDEERIQKMLFDLCKEGFIKKQRQFFSIV